MLELYKQINEWIDGLETKFEYIKEKHQADFLIAYKKHVNKIRQELTDIRLKNEEQEKNSRDYDKMQIMEK